ncbi:hypothetical protein [Lignipirellula cremea]|uniref:Uncharacterized protein n=1 Tax=Lignipirellula cremea TaxID=2528010 RepID=A0A518E1K3_9BACT|nr:hypothetical protein [Lignipirellula cremea]QDU97978.1 hypothetical protein Pla8534_58370 [Lignipirellula cremea]
MTSLLSTRLLAALLATSLIAGASLAQAQNPWQTNKTPWPRTGPIWQPAPSVDVEILSGDRVLARQTSQLRNDRYSLPSHVPALTKEMTFPRFGIEYSIRVTNRGTSRIVARVAVDGLSVMDGKPARDSGGYVLAAGQSYTITGWRINNDRVKAFLVSKPAESEAAKQGLSSQVGRISVTAIAELPPLPQTWGAAPSARSHTYGAAGGSFGASAGTASGREMSSQVRSVAFKYSNQRTTLDFHYTVGGSDR